jgi:lipoprotein NlpD
MPEMETHLESLQFHNNMYVVQAGETLDTIAFRYNLSRAELQSLNPGIESSFTPGLRINVRPGTQLAASVRARSGYSTPNQPVLTAQRPSMTQPGVSVNPTQTREVLVTEIPATARLPAPSVPVSPQITEERTVVLDTPVSASGYPKEEIIPDTLELEPAAQQRQIMNAELQQYVGSWQWPTDGQVARDYAPGTAGGHGVDIAGVPGQDVRAVAAGQVIYSGRNPSSGGGNLVIVRHEDNLMTTYGHADKLYVSEHDIVQAGDTLATLGANVRNESVLAFEVRQDGKPLNPLEFLPVR